jgi:hypothetical protein
MQHVVQKSTSQPCQGSLCNKETELSSFDKSCGQILSSLPLNAVFYTFIRPPTLLLRLETMQIMALPVYGFPWLG